MKTINDIKPYPNNAKLHSMEQVRELAGAIEEVGFSPPIEVDKDWIIIKGHCRFLSARKLGWTEVREGVIAKKGEKFIPVVVRDDLNEVEVMKARLGDNGLSSDDIDKIRLYKDLQKIKDGGGSLDHLGYKIDNSHLKGVTNQDQHAASEIKFSEELLLTHNYVVLYFDNDLDWQVAVDKLGLKGVKSGIKTEKSQKIGLGRVIKGTDVIKRL